MRNASTSLLAKLLSLLFAPFLLAACGSVSPDPPAQGSPSGLCCPVIGPTLGTCSGGRIVRAAMLCGGPKQLIQCGGQSAPTLQETAKFSVGTAPGGATRFNIQFMNGSRFQGSMISPDPACAISNGTDIDFTFGLVYTGDQGTETVNGATSPCITQSKVVYSSFNFDLVGNFIHEGAMKDRMHTTLDTQVINQLFVPSGGTPLAGRCMRWRQMP